MHTSRISGLLLFLASLFLLAPVGAIAKPGYVTTASPRSRQAELTLKGTHGYEIQIVEFKRDSLEVSASQGKNLVLYRVLHQVKGDEIAGRLPGVGQVALKFHPVGSPHKVPRFFPQCRGGGEVKQPGYFQGTIRFHGERGYTAAYATKAHGMVVTAAKEVCKRSVFEHHEPTQAQATRVSAHSKSARRAISFYGSTVALSPPAPPTTVFSASAQEWRGGMFILRLVTALGKAADLTPSDSSPLPASASVTPPGLFHGSAAFQRQSSSGEWTGTLSVSMPGLGPVALAGPGFSATLCQDSGCPTSAGQVAVQVIS
jgi:hypothetical protein